MLNELAQSPQNVLLISDCIVSEEVMMEALHKTDIMIGEVRTLYWGPENKEDFVQLHLDLELNGPEGMEIPDEAYEYIRDTDVLMVHFCPVSSRLLANADRLKVIMTNRGGVEHINVEAASERNIPVINCIRNADAVAEFVIGLMIDISRDITLSRNNLCNGLWQTEYYNTGFQKTLGNSIVGLIGMGNVGCCIARKLLGLGVHVMAYDDYVSEESLARKGLEGVEKIDDLDLLLNRSDFVSIHLRLVEATEKWFDYEKMKKMRKDAYLINSARGGVLNYDDLTRALNEGLIAGCALDVYANEPVDPEDPLLKMENVIATPHLAGTTLDSLDLSPLILARDVNDIMRNNYTDRIVNLNKLRG